MSGQRVSNLSKICFQENVYEMTNNMLWLWYQNNETLKEREKINLKEAKREWAHESENMSRRKNNSGLAHCHLYEKETCSSSCFL